MSFCGVRLAAAAASSRGSDVRSGTRRQFEAESAARRPASSQIAATSAAAARSRSATSCWLRHNSFELDARVHELSEPEPHELGRRDRRGAVAGGRGAGSSGRAVTAAAFVIAAVDIVAARRATVAGCSAAQGRDGRIVELLVVNRDNKPEGGHEWRESF